MKKGILRFLAVAMVMGVLLLTITSPVSACDEHHCDGRCHPPTPCGSQTWFLDSASHSVVPGAKSMTTDPSSLTPGNVDIAKSQSVIWCADEVAATDVTFPDGKWAIYIHTCGYWDATKCDVNFGYVDASGSFTEFATEKPCEKSLLGAVMEVHTQVGAATVPAGCYLAVRISNDGFLVHTVKAGDHCYDWGSRMASPCSDPGYPLPEASTAVLFGVGILGLGGFAYLRSKKQVTIL